MLEMPLLRALKITRIANSQLKAAEVAVALKWTTTAVEKEVVLGGADGEAWDTQTTMSFVTQERKALS
jgi:hypothetical protein